MAMDKLRVLKLFASCCDTGSFVDTARLFGISASTVSKALSRLETDLGLQLFQRSTRSMHLTDVGEQYLGTAKNVIAELEECEDNLKSQNAQATGLIRLTLPISYGRLYIRPMLKTFCEAYPDIRFDIQYDDAYVDMIENGFDLCIRSGTIQDSRLVARKLSPMSMLICASPDYIQSTPIPLSAAEFPSHPWIRFRFKQTGRVMPTMSSDSDEAIMPDAKRDFIVDDGEALAELCADGLGLTQLPHFIARNWLMSKKIVSIQPVLTPKSMGIYAIYPRRNYMPARVRLFIEHIKTCLAEMQETPERTWAQDL